MGRKAKVTDPLDKIDWRKPIAFLAAKYKVSRQRIGQLKASAKAKFPRLFMNDENKSAETVGPAVPAAESVAGTNSPVETANEVAGEAMDFGAIMAAGNKAFEQAELPGGAPAADPSPIVPEFPGESAEEIPIENKAASVPAYDSDVSILFRKVCCTSVKSAIGIGDEITKAYARQAGLSEEFINKTLLLHTTAPEEIDQFTESLDLVLKKHNIRPKHAEEITLALSGLRLASRFPLIWAELRREIAEQKKRRARHDEN